MIDRRALLLASTAMLFAAGARAQGPERLPVVASFSILGDFVRAVGGDRVAVTVLVGPNEDAHAYQPKPSDGRALSAARLVVMNGLSFEGWMERLARSANAGVGVVRTSDGIDRLPAGRGHGHGHAHAQWDPHGWQSAVEAKRYIANIRDALIAADPAGRGAYEENAARYLARLDALDAEIRALIERIPAADRRAITNHDAFAYFARAYGVEFIPAQGLSTEAEPTPAAIGRLIRQIRASGVKAVFAENVSNPRLIERIARETGARVGGTLYSDALSAADGPAATYIDLMRHNARTIAAALAPQS